MQRTAIFPLLGPALVCYVIADIASSRQGFDVFTGVLALTALALSFAGRLRGAAGAAPSERALRWLGLSASLSLLGVLGDQPLRDSVDLVEALARSLLGTLVLDLALTQPDRAFGLRFSRAARSANFTLGGLSGLVSGLSSVGALGGDSRSVVSAARLAAVAPCYLGLAVGAALSVRLLRPRLGSMPDALASNAWGVFALTPATALALVLALDVGRGLPAFLPLLAACSAAALYLGHVFILDPKKRLSASRISRDAVAGVLSAALLATGLAFTGPFVPREPLPLGLWTAATLLLWLGLFAGLRQLARRMLAPFGGRLLDALAGVEPQLAGTDSMEDLCRNVLRALRQGAGAADAQPLLYGFDPPFEARLDAAGAVHLRDQPPHEQLLARLQDEPGEILVRDALEARIVRSPRQRPLLEALREHDVLCVVPLMTKGELEGALLLPRAGRSSPLTLEEQDALRRHARWLSGMFSVLATRGRAEARVNAAKRENSAALEQSEVLELETARIRETLALLHAERLRGVETPTLVAYSPAMRELLAQLRALEVPDAPVLLVTESGLTVEPIARLLHSDAQRPAEPFIAMDCASLRSDHAASAVFGGDGPRGEVAGALRAADVGTLLLLDVAALPLNVQRRLATALTSGIARPAGDGAAYRVRARIVLSSREDLRQLAERGRCEPDLAAALSGTTFRVPSLRECPEDFESHVLLAIDQACRRLGRDPLGIEADALTALREASWRDNLRELQIVIERAVSVAAGPRVTRTDLERSASLPLQANPLEAPFDEIERRAILHALSRAAGNKSEAARLLGLPRTTLLDKLRRHKLDQQGGEARAN